MNRDEDDRLAIGGEGVSERNLMKEQNEEFYELHDLLEKYTKKEDWIEILKLNKQTIPSEKKAEVSITTWNEKLQNNLFIWHAKN